MISRERVFETLAHREPDRVPLYLWVFGQKQVASEVQKKYGSMERFYDSLELDICQTFPSKGLLRNRTQQPNRIEVDTPYGQSVYGNTLSLEEGLEAEFTDPDDRDLYVQVEKEVSHHKVRKGRAIFLQTPGVFEASNGIIGLETNMMEMAVRPELVARLYERVAQWNHRYIENAIEIGIDVIHVSDDWGMNDTMLFSPKMWWKLVYPAEKLTTDFVRMMGVPLSLHCDGYLMDVMEGVVQLGFQCLHPVQASAGMDPVQVKQRYGDKLTLYGGLDVRTVLGQGDAEGVCDEVRGVMRALKPGGGYIFCTSHMVQPGTPIEEVELAYQVALEESWY